MSYALVNCSRQVKLSLRHNIISYVGARLKKLMGKSAKKDLQEEPVADSSATLQGNSKGDDSSDSYEQVGGLCF